jgi:hypothetical protein
MKLVLSLAVTLLASTSFADFGKYCGVAKVNGTTDFYYATITDGTYDAKITGETADPKKIVKYIPKNDCICVEGNVEYQFGNYEFTRVTGLYECNGGPKLH